MTPLNVQKKREDLYARAERLAGCGHWERRLLDKQIIWSDETRRIYGVDEDCVPSHDLFMSMVIPADRHRVEEAAARLIETRILDIEFRIRRGDGQERILHSLGEVEFDDDQRPVVVFGIVRDLTAFRRGEQVAASGRARDGFAGPIPDPGYWEMDVEAGERYWSPEVFHILGFDPASAPSFDEVLDAVHPDDRKRVRNGMESAIDQRGRLDVEFRFVRADGQTRLIRVIAEPDLSKSVSASKVVGTMQDVTDIRYIQRELLDVTETLKNSQSAINRARDPVFRVNEGGAIDYANEAACHLFGYSREELVKLSVADIQTDLESGSWQKFLRSMKSAGRMTFESRSKDRLGRVFLVEITTDFLTHDSGDFVWAHVRDISERSQTERDLVASNRRLAAVAKTLKLANASPTLAAVLDGVRDGICKAVDATAAAIFLVEGHGGDLVLATHSGLPDDEKLLEALRRLPSGRGLAGRVAEKGLSLFLRERAGSHPDALDRRMSSFIGVPIFANDELLAVMTLSTTAPDVLTDNDYDLVMAVAEQVGMLIRNARLFEDNDLLATAIDQASEVISVTDTSGILKYVNPAFEWVTGFTREEAIGGPASIMKSGKHSSLHYKAMWDTILGGEVWVGRFINTKKDGTLWEAESTIAPVRDRSGKIVNFVEVKRDITREVELEGHLRQAQKMEAIGRLAGGIAHDFNNLLTVINGYSELLMGSLDGDSRLAADVAAIQRAGNKAADLTHQLLAFSRKQTLNPSVVDVNQSVANVEAMLRRVIGEDVLLHTDLSPRIGRIYADPSQLDQVLMNLAVNARDAMPDGGELFLRTGNIVLEEAFVRMREGAVAGPHVFISIRDTGTGMSPETLAQIFEPFFSTKLDEGTGLGLSMVYGIVAQSDGVIDVASTLGEGTTFTIYLPQAEASNVVSEAAGDHGPEHRFFGTETVLIVEDDNAVRRLAERILRNHGYTVLTASSASAVDSAIGTAPSVDLLLSDVIMPGTSGPVVAERLMDRYPELKVLFMSGHTGQLLERRMLESARLIRKPFTMKELARRVRGMFDDDGRDGTSGPRQI